MTDITRAEEEAGWASGPELFGPGILTSVVLCKYTGTKPFPECEYRKNRQHPDEDCRAIFHSSDALAEGIVHVDLPAEATRLGLGSADPTYSGVL